MACEICIEKYCESNRYEQCTQILNREAPSVRIMLAKKKVQHLHRSTRQKVPPSSAGDLHLYVEQPMDPVHGPTHGRPLAYTMVRSMGKHAPRNVPWHKAVHVSMVCAILHPTRYRIYEGRGLL